MIRILCICLLLTGCAPSGQNTIKATAQLDTQQAIADWKRVASETDGCSSTNGLHWLADIFLAKNWNDCCVQHDFDYREGYKYGITKEQADYGLWECVFASGHPFVANMMYDAVYLFGDNSYQGGIND